MALFLGTFIVMLLCGLALGLGALLGGPPISGACGRAGAGGANCRACPGKRPDGQCRRTVPGGENKI